MREGGAKKETQEQERKKSEFYFSNLLYKKSIKINTSYLKFKFSLYTIKKTNR